MSTEIPQSALGSLVSIIIDHRGKTPKKLGGDFVQLGIPVISAKSVKDGRIINEDDLRCVTQEMFDRWMSVRLQSGDVLLTSEAPLGEVAFLQDQYDYCLGQRLFALRADPHVLDGRFLYYALRSMPVQQRLHARATGTTAQGIRQSELVKVKVPVLPLEEQRAIAAVLGALDDKIELNRRMNATLEAMARALFTSWFVDFDPVRAKMEGRTPYGMDAATAALFPAALTDSSLGPIPAGWHVAPLPDVIAINPSRTLRKGEAAPYLDMKNMPTSGHRAIKWTDRAFGSGMRFINGDTLLARITPCLENGKTAFVDFLEDGQTGWGSTEYIVFHPKPPLPAEYAYFLARDEEFRAHAIQSMTGSSGRQRVPASCFDRYLLAVPPESVLRCFGATARSLMGKIRANSEQSRTLAIVRDALLPKLLSGAMRVRDAARVVAAV